MVVTFQFQVLYSMRGGGEVVNVMYCILLKVECHQTDQPLL